MPQRPPPQLWLAVARHVASGIRGRGNARAISSTVHMVSRPAVPLRDARDVSFGVTTDAELPKLLRMKLATSAIAASLHRAHRRHHFGVVAAVDGAGQTVEQRADDVVAGDRSRVVIRRVPEPAGRAAGHRRAAPVLAVAGEAALRIPLAPRSTTLVRPASAAGHGCQRPPGVQDAPGHPLDAARRFSIAARPATTSAVPGTFRC